MKKSIIIAIATLALSLSSFGATLVLDCANVANSTNGGGGGEVVTCAAFNSLPANFQITSVGLFLLSSFNGNGSPAVGADGQLQINAFYNPSIGVPDTTTCNLDSAQVTSSIFCGSAAAPVFIAGGSFTNTYNAFTVDVTFSKGIDANNLYQGQATGAVAVVYTYSIPSSVPEPTTIALMGAGLLALGSAARRRR